MKGKSRNLVFLLFFFGISCQKFIRMVTAEEVEDKYSVLSKMFNMVFESMKLQDDRLGTLENTANLNQCKMNADGQQDTETQLKSIQDNIEQVKAYLNHMGKGLAEEKVIRTKNTNAIEKNTGNIAEVVKNVNDSYVDLHQTLTQQKDAEKDLIKDLVTKFKPHEDKMNSHTDKMKNILIQNFTGDLAEHEREMKEEMKKVTHVIEKLQREMKEEIKKVTHVMEKIQSKVDLMEFFLIYKIHNVAKGKNAKQSSVSSGGEASRATDGNSDGVWSHASCTHTETELNPWWQVDLAGRYVVKRVVIKNRSDCCGERLHNLVISVSKDKGSNEEICGRFEGPSKNGANETIICSHPIIGRYVKIQIHDTEGTSTLTLCEVNIFSA